MVEDYDQVLPDLVAVHAEPLEEEHRSFADEDLEEMVKQLKVAQKRRGATGWSAPRAIPDSVGP